MKCYLVAAVIVLAAIAVTAANAAAIRTGNPTELWVIGGGMNAAEQMLTATLQGHTARDNARIWVDIGGMSKALLDQMKHDGVKIHHARSVWDLVKQFRSKIDGGIVYKTGNESVSVVTSLCGVMRAVAIEESLLDKAKTAGLPIIQDVRTMTERDALAKYRGKFKRGIAVCQALDKIAPLRDFAVANRAFVFHHDDSAFCTQVTREFGPAALVYGWGADEHRWVRDISRGNGTAVPADWCMNLSIMQNLPCKIKRPADKPVLAEDGTRYVAFVMSDGDNIQALCGGFAFENGWWGNPHRGTFPMTWEMSPVFADAAPRVLQFFYNHATPNDGFVTGPGVPGYTFQHFQTDRRTIAKQAAGYVRRSDMSIVSVLNDNAGSLEDTFPLLDQPQIDAVIYKDFAPYDRRKGEIAWHNGKPCVAYRFMLWQGMEEPEDIAKAVAKMPAAPKTDLGSFALINVHAWSYSNIGGPMEAVRKTIELLPKGTKVVTANQLIGLMCRCKHSSTK
jgi:hypothetical protein